jgi:hypothetical protein
MNDLPIIPHLSNSLEVNLGWVIIAHFDTWVHTTTDPSKGLAFARSALAFAIGGVSAGALYTENKTYQSAPQVQLSLPQLAEMGT